MWDRLWLWWWWWKGDERRREALNEVNPGVEANFPSNPYLFSEIFQRVGGMTGLPPQIPTKILKTLPIASPTRPNLERREVIKYPIPFRLAHTLTPEKTTPYRLKIKRGNPLPLSLVGGGSSPPRIDLFRKPITS